MFHRLAAVCAVSLAISPVCAETDLAAINAKAVASHVLPRVGDFQIAAAALNAAARQDCDPASDELVQAYHAAFDAWTRMSHLRFGPTEVNDRAFAIAFWPDGRGKTPKALATLLTENDPAIENPETFANTTIAARGLYALEFLLFDDTVKNTGEDISSCRLIRAIALDTSRNADGIAGDWQDYAKRLTAPTEGGTYRSDAEATQELYKTLSTGLQFTSDTRLGRPLGTFDRPRPTRAELRRSGRSLRQVSLSLEGTEELALILAMDAPAVQAHLRSLYEASYGLIEALDDPVFQGVDDVQGRLRVEILQMSVDAIREVVTLELGPALGVAAGFNALDGD